MTPPPPPPNGDATPTTGLTVARAAALGAVALAIVVVGVVLLSSGGDTTYKVRFQNAGQLVKGDEVLKLHLVPSGVLYPHITSVIGNGVVVNPETLIGELDMLIAGGYTGDMILLDVPADRASATLARLDQFLFSEDVQLADLSATLTSVSPTFSADSSRSRRPGVGASTSTNSNSPAAASARTPGSGSPSASAKATPAPSGAVSVTAVTAALRTAVSGSARWGRSRSRSGGCSASASTSTTRPESGARTPADSSTPSSGNAG